jgi:hypothetical protein
MASCLNARVFRKQYGQKQMNRENRNASQVARPSSISAIAEIILMIAE